MQTQQKALFKESSQMLPLSIKAEFPCMDEVYEATVRIELALAYASVPCATCGKTSRQLLQQIGVEIDSDDTKIDMLEVIAEIPVDNKRPFCEPTNVFVIVDAFIKEEPTNTITMTKVRMDSPIFMALNLHVKKILKGKIVCNGCGLTETFFNEALSA